MDILPWARVFAVSQLLNKTTKRLPNILIIGIGINRVNQHIPLTGRGIYDAGILVYQLGDFLIIQPIYVCNCVPLIHPPKHTGTAPRAVPVCFEIQLSEAQNKVLAGVGTPMKDDVCRVSMLNLANRKAENAAIRNAV